MVSRMTMEMKRNQIKQPYPLQQGKIWVNRQKRDKKNPAGLVQGLKL